MAIPELSIFEVGAWIGDLCNFPLAIFILIGVLGFSMDIFLRLAGMLVVRSFCFISTKCISLNCYWDLGQMLDASLISFSIRILYLCHSLLMDSLSVQQLCNFSFIYCFKEWDIFFIWSLLFPFLFCICHKTLRKQGGFIWVIFLHVVWVFFPTVSTSFPVVTIFLTFKAPQGCRDVLYYLLKGIYDSNFIGYFGLTEHRNVCICLNFLSALSGCYSFVVGDTLFFQNCCYLLHCNQGQVSTSNNSFWGV